MRLQIWEWSGVRVLDDAYNANADSMLAALQSVAGTAVQRPARGGAGGHGANSARTARAAHAEVGRRAAELGVGQLIAVGKMAGVMAQAARDAGLNRVIELADVEAAVTALKSFLKAGDTVLLKASRASRLERIDAKPCAAERERKEGLN